MVRAFGDRGLRLEARALAMLTSHVEQAAEKAQAALKGMAMNVDGIGEGEGGFDNDSSSSSAAAAAAAAADAALAKLLDAYEPGEITRLIELVDFKVLRRRENGGTD